MNENHTELISVTNGSIEFKKKLLELIRTSVTQNNNSTEIYDESQIVHRNEWHARPPGNPIPPLALPAFRVIIAHTVTPNCLTLVNYFKPLKKLNAIFKLFRDVDNVGRMQISCIKYSRISYGVTALGRYWIQFSNRRRWYGI